MMTLLTPDPRDHVQVSDGDVSIAKFTAERALASRYAAAMARRFPCLRVTCTPIVARAED
jgi:hypothetical protein